MRLSISNIAWDVTEDDAVAAQLKAAGLDRVDIAPGKYFPDPEAASLADMELVRRQWEARGFAIEGMQALLFGTSGLNLFADPDGVMLRRLAGVCRIGQGVGARALTFGSPRQRDRSGLDDETTRAIAVDFFRRLGDAAAAAEVVVCLEPNPAIYNCNFMVTTAEAAAMVEAVDHPAIRLQLDVGALALNEEPVAETIARFGPLAGHVHASEPQLKPLGDAGASHAAAAEALAKARPDLVVTIEMAATANEPHAEAIARAVALARATYGAQGATL